MLIVSGFHVSAADLYTDLDEAGLAAKQAVLARIHTNPLIVQPLYQMIKDTVEILTHFDVNHWACFGTLLGAVRHEPPGLIPWDDDADFGVDKKDEEKLKNPTLRTMFVESGYEIFSDEDGDNPIVGYKVYKRDMIYLGHKDVRIFLDLFLFEQDGDRYVLSRPKGREFFRNPYFTLAQIETKQDYRFGAIALIGPSDAGSFFTRFYGSEWNEIALHYFSHVDGEPRIKHKWSLTSPEARVSSLPREPLEDRVARLLALEMAGAEESNPPEES